MDLSSIRLDSPSFWFGSALTLIIGIVTAIIANYVQRAIDKRSAAHKARQDALINEIDQRADQLVKADPVFKIVALHSDVLYRLELLQFVTLVVCVSLVPFSGFTLFLVAVLFVKHPAAVDFLPHFIFMVILLAVTCILAGIIVTRMLFALIDKYRQWRILTNKVIEKLSKP